MSSFWTRSPTGGAAPPLRPAARLLPRLGRAACLAVATALAGAGPVAAAESPLQCEAVPGLMRHYLQGHVTWQELSPELKRRTIDTYVRRLDPTRTLLLASEASDARVSLSGFFERARGGDCQQLRDLRDLMVGHHQRTEAFVRQLLEDEGFEIDPKASLVIDPDERGQPETPKRRDEINRSLVHFQLARYLAADTPIEKAKKSLIHRYELRSSRAAATGDEDLYAAFLDAFAVSLDPHSDYFSPEDQEDFNIQMRLKLSGIGVALSERDGFAVAERIIPKGAADRQGELRPNDKIIAVAQEGEDPVDIIDMPLREAVALIRGEAGTVVDLTILREKPKPRRFHIKIERADIDLAERAANMELIEHTVGERKIKLAVLELPSFYGDQNFPESRQCSEDVAALLAEARAAGAQGLLLDLSSNGGGALEHAVRISGFFIRTGEIVRVENGHRRQPMWDRDDSVLWSGPMVVHTSRISASASEILAGALKDYRRAIVTGDDHTFGKGTVQTVRHLPRGLGALKITTALFYRPSGVSTQKSGVRSHVLVPSLFGREGLGEAAQDYALEAEPRKPFLSKSANREGNGEGYWTPLSDELVAQLAERSRARVESSDDFAEVREKLAEAQQNGVLELAEVLEQQREAAESNGDSEPESEEAQVAEEQTPPGPQRQEALNVLADLVIGLES